MLDSVYFLPVIEVLGVWLLLGLIGYFFCRDVWDTTNFMWEKDKRIMKCLVITGPLLLLYGVLMLCVNGK
jgi:hypothetical protein